MKYIKRFQTHQDYIDWNDGEIIPNLCYCEDFEEIHINKKPEDKVIIHYANITDDPIYIYGYRDSEMSSHGQEWFIGVDNINKIINNHDHEIVDIENVDYNKGYYQFNESRDDTYYLKYKFTDSSIIPTNAFQDCSLITEVILPDTIQSIGENAFYACRNLANIELPNSVKQIDNCAFYGCTGLTTINLKPYITQLGDLAFSDSGLTNINLPSTIRTYGNSIFINCSELTNVTLPNSNNFTTIPEAMFANCTSLSNIIIPNKVTEIGMRAFSGCTGLSTLPNLNNVNKIGNKAFKDCTGITGSIEFNENLLQVDENAFSGCTGITSIRFTENIVSIRKEAFKNCTNLKSVYVERLTPPALGTDVFSNTHPDFKIYVPAESLNAYRTADNWSDWDGEINPIS